MEIPAWYSQYIHINTLELKLTFYTSTSSSFHFTFSVLEYSSRATVLTMYSTVCLWTALYISHYVDLLFFIACAWMTCPAKKDWQRTWSSCHQGVFVFMVISWLLLTMTKLRELTSGHGLVISADSTFPCRLSWIRSTTCSVLRLWSPGETWTARSRRTPQPCYWILWRKELSSLLIILWNPPLWKCLLAI